MKKIISIVAIIALVAVIFTLAACGGGGTDNSTTKNTTTTANSTTDKMTSIKDEGSSMMEDLSSAISGIGDDLTAEGNVTDNKSTTGLLEGLTSDNTDVTTANAADTTVAAE